MGNSCEAMSIPFDELRGQLNGNKNFNRWGPESEANLLALRQSAIPSSSLYWNMTGLVQKVPPPPPRVQHGQAASSPALSRKAHSADAASQPSSPAGHPAERIAKKSVVPITIARNFKKLTRLDCRQCPLISNMGVVQLANEAQCLKELFLSGCTAITDESGDAFETGFHKLSYLNIHGCTGLSPEQIMRIVKAKPLVEIHGNIPVVKKMSWIDLLGKAGGDAAKGGKKKKKRKKKKKK